MTLIEIPDEQAAALKAKAAAAGFTLEAWLKSLAEGRLQMAALNWSHCPAVESVPGKLKGSWVFKDTRMPVSAVFENLEDSITIEELIELYDGLTREQVEAVLDFAARSTGTPAVTQNNARTPSIRVLRSRSRAFSTATQFRRRDAKAGTRFEMGISCLLRKMPALTILTTDNSIEYQQNLKGRRIAIVVLTRNRWRSVQRLLPGIKAAVDGATPGSYERIEVPIK